MMLDAILARRDVSPSAKLVLLALCAAGTDRLEQITLGDRLGFSTRHVQRKLAELRRVGLLTWTRRGGNRSNVYTVLLEAEA